MRVLVRADASDVHGAGHVMRCLTLAEELSGRGHEVVLAAAIERIPWLSERVAAASYTGAPASFGVIDAAALAAVKPDWVVLDLPAVDVAAASELARRLPMLLVSDGPPAEVPAALFLEQNLGSEVAQPPTGTLLAGPRYVLVRRAIRELRRPEPWLIVGVPRVLVVMGGTDATAAVPETARRLGAMDASFELTVVTAATIDASPVAGGAEVRVVEPGAGLDSLLAASDIVVCAGGTTLWDVATLGIPTIAVAVADNQRASVRAVVQNGLALGFDAPTFDGLEANLRRLLDDEGLRRELSEAATGLFDGLGAGRVVDVMEASA